MDVLRADGYRWTSLETSFSLLHTLPQPQILEPRCFTNVQTHLCFLLALATTTAVVVRLPGLPAFVPHDPIIRAEALH